MRNLLVKVLHKFIRLKSLLIIFPAILLMISLTKSIEKVRQANLQVKEKEEMLNKVVDENKVLEARLREARDDIYIEKQLRDKLGYAKEGEIVVILPEDDVLRKLAPEEKKEEETLPDPNWKKWMKVFDL
ncbi:hypothetical protein A2962_03970 [Candidatus Woesebacteria bacterium RIFCSPLOWO2_01_FULL_39_61]|uniref:Septum formation initiator n=1 Tax=Candidatus Woesebacteria bacterium RIFCSPHIGHO2_02_FULL_39_13 TaxID=1802505 RepID=A0A1F7Z4V7_9BACT|nr:MAG: hypothetical protein A2692_02290 [Candidatus Woesebacteria bacterium RIFCSPHIGHO2_01_FULL_39_95]OGM33938.1 MAG: hypothetical protein A3D01_05975 [Candidatus Woesebacteria bacterium RIFCSPHIGHO2_02_FULL_39_13]OGM37227.1 MAG: hypothetical protein A3E13_03305 [Candidatus Woesebacteria bacterium RIFCSPHIGHO2_12_FULL_40_20]OGM65912.1 MAG: hypothetical protein A2962_03970 [Candidatus Woesebacteria bacterium RIFCSPLOWO2_01_FULL_39_61]OGM71448.1 MAG: hypothetical protein A3H19_04770 [Candidatus